MKTPQLTEAALDQAVAKREGMIRPDGGTYAGYHGNIHRFKPSTEWAQGGPIIEREKLTLSYDSDWKYDSTEPEDNGERWLAESDSGQTQYGPTPLIAAMRCYVASELGGEVEIPAKLTQGKA